MKRRIFIKKAALGAYAFSSLPLLTYSCNSPQQKAAEKAVAKAIDLKLSLAQWSLNRQFFDGSLNAVDFANIAMDKFGINAVEYVNAFYEDEGENEAFWMRMKERADGAGVKSLLIMVDREGELGVADEKTRLQSVENHYKWVNAAKLLGCHSIRVNAFGEADRGTFRSAMIDGLGRLAEYGAQEQINILIENHGLYSSDAKLITDILQQVDNPYAGTLPDFGNWCLSAKWGSTQGECDDAYDVYQGVSEFLPYAKGVSAKAYTFNAQGEHPAIDYYKMLKIVKDAGFEGYIGIEYEGEGQEDEGIRLTKALIEKVWSSLG